MTTVFENNHIKVIKNDHEYSIIDKHRNVCVFEIGHNEAYLEAENIRLKEYLEGREIIDNKKIFTRAEISAMDAETFSKYEKQIFNQMATGLIK